MIAIRGARGVGKSTIIRQYIRSHYAKKDPTALYCSLEDFKDLQAFIEQIYKQCKPMAYFDKYLKYGYYPYYMNNPVEYYALINNVGDM